MDLAVAAVTAAVTAAVPAAVTVPVTVTACCPMCLGAPNSTPKRPAHSRPANPCTCPCPPHLLPPHTHTLNPPTAPPTPFRGGGL